MYSESVSIQTVTLERLAFAVNTAVSRELIDDLASPIKGEWLAREMAHRLVYQLRTGIASQHLDRATVRHPATWWDGVKQAFYHWCGYAGGGHWPWFGEDYGPRKWPVQENIITIDVKALYPKVAMKDERHTVVVFRQEEIRPWRRPKEKADETP